MTPLNKRNILYHLSYSVNPRERFPFATTGSYLPQQRPAFGEECRLDYPWSLIDSVISNFVSRKPSVGTAERNADESNILRINLPFKDQVSANSVRRQLRDLSN